MRKLFANNKNISIKLDRLVCSFFLIRNLRVDANHDGFVTWTYAYFVRLKNKLFRGKLCLRSFINCTFFDSYFRQMFILLWILFQFRFLPSILTICDGCFWFSLQIERFFCVESLYCFLFVFFCVSNSTSICHFNLGKFEAIANMICLLNTKCEREKIVVHMPPNRNACLLILLLIMNYTNNYSRKKKCKRERAVFQILIV